MTNSFIFRLLCPALQHPVFQGLKPARTGRIAALATMGCIALSSGCQKDRLTEEMETLSRTYEREWQRSQTKRTDYICQLVDDNLSANFPHLRPYEGDYVLGTYSYHFVVAGAAFSNGFNRKYNSVKNIFIGEKDKFLTHPAFFSSDLKIFDSLKGRPILAEGQANAIALSGEICTLTTTWRKRGTTSDIVLSYKVNLDRSALQVQVSGYRNLRLQYLYKIQNEAFLADHNKRILPAGRLYSYRHDQSDLFTKMPADLRIASTGGKFGFTQTPGQSPADVVTIYPSIDAINRGFFDPIAEGQAAAPYTQITIANALYKNTVFYNAPFKKWLYHNKKPIFMLYGRYNQPNKVQLPAKGPFQISIAKNGRNIYRPLAKGLDNGYSEGAPGPLTYAQMTTDKPNFPATWRTRVTRVDDRGQLIGETREIPTSLNHSFVLDKGNFYINVINRDKKPVCQFYLKKFAKQKIKLSCSSLNAPRPNLALSAKTLKTANNRWRKVSKDSLFSLTYDRRKFPQQDIAFMDFDQLATHNAFRHQQPIPLDLGCEAPLDSLLPLLNKLERVKPKTVNIENCFMNPRAVAYQVELHKLAKHEDQLTPYVSDSYRAKLGKPIFWDVVLDKMDSHISSMPVTGISSGKVRTTDLRLQVTVKNNQVQFYAKKSDPKINHRSIKLYINDRAFETKNASALKLALPMANLPLSQGLIIRMTTVSSAITEFQYQHRLISDEFNYFISKPFQIVFDKNIIALAKKKP